MNTGTHPPFAANPPYLLLLLKRLRSERPETSTNFEELVNGKRISIRNVPVGKTGLPFQNFRLSREFSSGTNPKNVYHLHPNRNFREFVVNGKQPQCRKMIDEKVVSNRLKHL